MFLFCCKTDPDFLFVIVKIPLFFFLLPPFMYLKECFQVMDAASRISPTDKL